MMYHHLNRSLLAGLLFAASSMLLPAQNGGSIYSSYNIGDLRGGTISQAGGRAGVETPIPGRAGLNFGNPAAWSSLRFVAIQAGLSFEQVSTTVGEQTSAHNNVSLNHFAVGFPVSDSLGLTIGAGIRPYSTVNYVTGGSLTLPSADTTVSGAAVYTGSGGVSEAFLGFGVEPVDGVSIGAHASVLFGEIERVSRLDFSTPGFINAGYVTTESYNGIGLTVAALVEPLEDLRVGVTFSPAITLDTENEVLGLYRVSSGDDTANVAATSGTSTLPSAIRGGVSWTTGRTLLAAEVQMQSWGGTQAFPANGKERMKLAVSADYLPDDAPGASGIDRWTFRAGLYRDETYVMLENEGVNAMGAGIGASVPFARTGVLGSGATLDFGLDVGVRSTANSDHPDELSARLSAGITINEFWFQ